MGKGVKRSRHTLKEKPSFRYFPVFGNVQHGNPVTYHKFPKILLKHEFRR